LEEHVEEREPEMKDGYQCMNPVCKAHEMNATWIKDGDMYIKEPVAGMNWTEATNEVEKYSLTGRTEAVNSWASGYAIYREKQTKETIVLDLYWFIIKWIPRFSRIEHEVPIWKKDGTWSRTIMRRTKGGRYIHFMTLWDIFWFEYSDYTSKYNSILAYKDPETLKELVKKIDGQVDDYPWSHDNNFWWKSARWLVCNVIFFEKSKIIKGIRL
jgi:hypothetical protein